MNTVIQMLTEQEEQLMAQLKDIRHAIGLLQQNKEEKPSNGRHLRNRGDQANVLRALHTGHTTSKEIALAMKIPTERVEHSITALIATRLVAFDGKKLSLTPTGKPKAEFFANNPGRKLYVSSR